MRISTDRLELSAPGVDAWRALLEGDIGPAVADYPTEGDLVMALLVVDGYLAAGEWGPWQVVERGTGLLVGGVGFKGAPDDAGIVEIGYGIAPSVRGRGIATEAVRALVEHAWARGARVVRAEVEEGHGASEGVVTRAGFSAASRDSGATWWQCDRP